MKTVNDIKTMQVLVVCKDGTVIAGIVDDLIVKNVIAQHVKFVELDPSKFTLGSIKDLVKDT